MNAERRLIRRVAAAWATKLAFSEWNPPIPQELLSRVAFMPDTEEGLALEDARDSVAVFLPKILDTLRKATGERYYANASESHGKIFYYFAPRQPIDSFNLTVWVHGPNAQVSFGYIPTRVDGSLDIANMKSVRLPSSPETAGMAVMRALRDLLSKL
jgi:hypothetical protein